MRGNRMPAAALLLGAALALAACSDGGAHVTASSPPPAAPASGSPTPPPSAIPGATAPPSGSTTAQWPSYHADAARTAAVAGTSPEPAKHAWSTDLGAAVFGQPVIMGDRVFAGTEENRVVALERTTGRQLWSHTLGAPLTKVQQKAGCGNIDPLGITSSLAIDPALGEVFAVGEVVAGGKVDHRLVGLDVTTGEVKLEESVDPPLGTGEASVHLLQRAGLALGNGRVYVGYGGNIGDCGLYHGWLVGASETKQGDLVSFKVAPDGEGGAIWLSGGAPAIGADGSVYVTTGNANPFPAGMDRFEYTESVVKLSPTLEVLASFKDPAAGGDEDLATGNPVLLPGDLVFAVGKTDVGYLLRTSDLGRVAEVRNVCGSDPDGGPAYDPPTQRLLVPCRGGGIQVIDVPARKLAGRLAGANSAPIVIGANVWATSYPGGGLVELDSTSGRQLQKLTTGPVPNFATPSFADGMLFLGTRAGVVAFGN